MLRGNSVPSSMKMAFGSTSSMSTPHSVTLPQCTCSKKLERPSNGTLQVIRCLSTQSNDHYGQILLHLSWFPGCNTFWTWLVLAPKEIWQQPCCNHSSWINQGMGCVLSNSNASRATSTVPDVTPQQWPENSNIHGIFANTLYNNFCAQK